MTKNKNEIKKAKDGTYYFRVFLGKNSLTGKRIQKYRSGFKTQKEAKEALSALRVEKSSFLESSIDEEKELKIMFSDFIEDIFLPYYKTRVKLRTYENRAQTIRKHFQYFYHLAVSDIEPLHVQAWQIELSKNLSRSYIRNVQGIFSVAMDRAVVLNLTEKNPSKIVGNVKKQKTKVEFWTKEEFERVISFIYTEDYYQHFLFVSLWLLFMTGMRSGEATALYWKDIDFETGTLNITKTLFYKNQREYYPVEPKTRASIRQIVLDDVTLEFLKKWKQVQKEVITTDFVLSYNGIPTQKHTLARAIERFSKLAGVHRIKLHALRHSHASLLISMGENAILIKDRLGHEDIETTLGTYGHLYPNSNFGVATRLSGIVNYQPSQTNNDMSPSNGFTVKYREKVAMELQ
ncbi:integrase [Enterococcus silesiacus]|uniref:Integrase n=1 Tax=Enterococcus silesiacus TaxID=332949 RepID=A0A0S3KCP0_9ENTE|nr:tyrosine-type recombinase/integrase [Enterococcus silesiacus]ALS02039.1 integrase [Enterococcus silesiacus]OJG88959.1 hypothetical protein RV15_GL001695 [Enterococcus silesiacus]